MRFVICLFIAGTLQADPGWGLVQDRGGNISFGDVLRNVVWRITPDGATKAIAQGRHAHSLCLDASGALWGDHTDYNPQTQKFSRTAWRLDAGKAIAAPLPQGPCANLFQSRSSPSPAIPRDPQWEIWAALRSGDAWILLEHAPPSLFEGLLRDKKPATRVRRLSSSGVSRVLFQI
jgi:hypothetical protein